jgi:hypothetical protein
LPLVRTKLEAPGLKKTEVLEAAELSPCAPFFYLRGIELNDMNHDAHQSTRAGEEIA